MEEAESLLLQRLNDGSDAVNPLASMRITDVLSSINARREPGQAAMTTGAAYQIWESQTDFQDELLDRIMRRVSTPWADRVRPAVDRAMVQARPFHDMLIALSEDSGNPGEAAELTLALGLTAFVGPKRVRRAERKANAEYLKVLGGILAEILDYGDREPLPGLAIADIVWSVEAVAAGMNLRARSHPEIVARRDDAGHDLGALSIAAIVEGMTRPREAPGRPASRRRAT
jgi:hypothetical protein